MVSELIVLRKIVNELLQPAQTILRPKMRVQEIDKCPIHSRQRYFRFRDRATAHVAGDPGKEPGADHGAPAKHETVCARYAQALMCIPDREDPSVRDNGDHKPLLYPGNARPSRISGKGLMFQPGVDRDHIDALILEHAAK